MSSIFGGSKNRSQSRSSNQAYGQINQSVAPVMDNVGQSANAMSSLLGGDASGFNAYKQATGFDALTEQGARGIMGSGAARGLLRSGASGMALANYANNMQNQYAQNYMNNLMGQGQLGLGAGNLLASAGQTSESNSSGRSKPGLGGLLGGGLSLVGAG